MGIASRVFAPNYGVCRCVLVGLFVVATSFNWTPPVAGSASVAPEVLPFYYGWYGNPQVSGEWRHWKNVDPVNQRIENATDFPKYGAYDSHDPTVVDQQAEAAHDAGITGFIASWWGRDGFEDRGMPLLLAAAGKHKLLVSAYYEKIAAEDTASRIKAAVGDIDQLLSRYSGDKAWLRAGGKPVLFVYNRALHELSPADWQAVIAQVRQDNPGGVVLVADSQDRAFVSIFDGASTYNITGQTHHKSPRDSRLGSCRLSENDRGGRFRENYPAMTTESFGACRRARSPIAGVGRPIGRYGRKQSPRRQIMF
jgi:Glycosyl hydrolase family 99